MTDYSPDSGTLAGVASIIAAFSAAMLFFRIQRELAVPPPNWIARSDWLLLASSSLSLLLVISPLLLLPPSNPIYHVLPSAACAGATVCVAGYPFAILAHYRLLLGRTRSGPRENPEPAERWIIVTTWLVSLSAFVWAIWIRMR